MRKLAIDLVKYKLLNMEEEEVIQMINNIRKYLINRTDYKTNQQYIGLKHYSGAI